MQEYQIIFDKGNGNNIVSYVVAENVVVAVENAILRLHGGA